MELGDYRAYVSAETMMGPNSAKVLKELLDRHPLQLDPGDTVLDLGCGKGLTSLILAKETGANVLADDLWVSAEENERRFAAWGLQAQVTPICQDANDLHFEQKQFGALVSIDAYHYFGGNKGFLQEKILPFIKDGGAVLIGVPGLKDAYTDCGDTLLADWLGDDWHMFKSPRRWSEIIGSGGRIESAETWEMDCFGHAWDDWLATDHPFALGDRQYFETVIRPYTCFVGISIKLKKRALW